MCSNLDMGCHILGIFKIKIEGRKMKRTKEWWAALTREQRSRLVFLERNKKCSGRYGGGGYLPDDCCECGACSTPHTGTGLCPYCVRERCELVAAADRAIYLGLR